MDDDYFPIVESAMDDSREALQRFCQQDPTADPRMPPMNLNDSVRIVADVTAVVVVVVVVVVMWWCDDGNNVIT